MTSTPSLSLLVPTQPKQHSVRVARVEDYLMAHLRDPITSDQLAQVSGVSIRTLSREFRVRHGVGPMGFLRQRRMEAVRRELLAAAPDSTRVSKIATQYGFTDWGKFSAAYKAAYGELPSQTLRRPTA